MSDQERHDQDRDQGKPDLEEAAKEGPIETGVGQAQVAGAEGDTGDTYAEREEAEDEGA